MVYTFNTFISALLVAIEEQENATIQWHKEEVDTVETTLHTLSTLILSQHLMNYKLWHTEDIARRKDVDASVIAECKYTIDIYNQKRNNFMEEIDRYCITALTPLLPKNDNKLVRYNSETLGMIVDRLSILALKIYHMKEESLRKNSTAEHIEFCTNKLDSLQQQRTLLITALTELLEEYQQGIKTPFVYLQHKMYNDPKLNPQLYNNEK